jgi:hypothetical protein
LIRAPALTLKKITIDSGLKGVFEVRKSIEVEVE